MSRATQVPVSREAADFVYGAVTRCGRTFQTVPLSLPHRFADRPYNPGCRRDGPGLGSSAFARHYLRNHCYFLFLRVIRCFSSPGSPSTQWSAGVASGGLPHSEIRG